MTEWNGGEQQMFFEPEGGEKTEKIPPQLGRERRVAQLHHAQKHRRQNHLSALEMVVVRVSLCLFDRVNVLFLMTLKTGGAQSSSSSLFCHCVGGSSPTLPSAFQLQTIREECVPNRRIFRPIRQSICLSNIELRFRRCRFLREF